MENQSEVVVITGASSGLGRETALQFAREGASVVLAARRKDALEETARMCRAAGCSALVVVTDVTRPEEVQRLVDAALASFGKIDVWINNAGVTAFGSLEGSPLEAHLRVIETNLYGAIHGARAVIPVFRRQGRGTLINVGSLLSKIGQPFVPSYVISKHGLAGLTEALRAELADQPEIRVCTILPYAMNTPHFQTGANYMGMRAHAMPPAQSPRRVARVIVGLSRRPRRVRLVPRSAVLGLALHLLFPDAVERAIYETLAAWHFDPSKRQLPTQGNLFAPPTEPARVAGRRAPRLSTPGLLGWLLKRVIALQLRAIGKRLISPSQRPRATLPPSRTPALELTRDSP